MPNNRLRPAMNNFRTAEKQRFSIKGLGAGNRTLPVYINNHDKAGNYHERHSRDFWSIFRNLHQRIPYFSPQQSHLHFTTHTKEPSSPGSAQNMSSITFVLLCVLWYSTSALSSNTGKAILTRFRYPITLTFVQFGFIAVYCLLFMSPLIRFTKLRMPSKAILQSTLPMGMFQVGGHMFSSMAISRIPVSTVHTIKALSPLFTVAAYALLFGVSYSNKTYISLLPLTFGVMLACSFDVSASNAIGLLCAFGSALVFVSSNIFFKKIMPSNTGGSTPITSHKLDKLNLLLYSSGMAFLLMTPLWMYYDLPILISASDHPEYGRSRLDNESAYSVGYYFFMNGTVHFAQNIIAFIILSSTSPVTYSIASLIKRVAVICIAIVWFKQTVHPIQAIGIVMTFTGLYMYNQSKADVEKGEQKMRRVEAARGLMLPTTKADSRMMGGIGSPPPGLNLHMNDDIPTAEASGTGLVSASVYGRNRAFSQATISTYSEQVSPTLRIDTTAPFIHKARHQSMRDSQHITSPVDSYPSPPPSIDSPPPRILPLDDTDHKAGSGMAVS